MIDHSKTTRALSQITDAGLFERLATAVLRQANPKLYGNLTHPGMNVDGKTVKAPIDCISFVTGAIPPHMVAAHHTSSATDDLRQKWLNDPSMVTPHKGTKPTAPPGDVIKTMYIVSGERKRTPELHVTLALTTNREPPQDLTRDIAAAANSYGISIDIWSCSRIADYLDNNPDGQWLRNYYLGIVQKQLSKQLLRVLSRASLDTIPLMARVESLINRELDRFIADRAPRPITFLVGESGVGKTIACYKHLQAHIEAGGCGLVLTPETLTTHRTLNQALDTELRNLHPNLEPEAGVRALSITSTTEPLLILVEDINRSDHPSLLLERLVGWGASRDGNTMIENPNWRLLCPVWPQVLAMTSDEARKRIEALSVSAMPFTKDEGRAAVERSAALANVPISTLEANNLAEELGNDPLLIALYNFVQKPEPHRVISEFIETSLTRLAGTFGTFTLTEYREALKALASGMLSHHRVDPTWLEIQEWFRGQPDILAALRQIVRSSEIVRLIDREQVERLSFRHDRVRSCLLSESVADVIRSGHLGNAVLSEPFFADVIGIALADPRTPLEVVSQVGTSNPLALFYALKTFRETKDRIHQAILDAIEAWLSTKETHGRANRMLRWGVLQVLSETESSHVVAIAKKFQEQIWPALEARFRNGDVSAGLDICLKVEPGVGAPWRDHLIAHAKVRFGENLIHELDELLKLPDLSSRDRSGGLRLAGHLAQPALAEAIAACWASDPDRTEHLADYLWAAAECCGDNPEQLLKPICDAWGVLPDEPVRSGLHSPRSDLAAHEISWAFNDALPTPTLRYFIARSRQEDLHGPITYMLRNLDHPDAVELIAREFASFSRKAEETGGFSPFPSMIHSYWERQQREKGKGMTMASRQRLQSLWIDPDNDKHLRREAFLLWAATSAADDVELLRKVEDSILMDDVLRARLKRGDETAIPALVQKIRNDRRGYWWQYGRFVWSDDLTNALDEDFRHRRNRVELVWGVEYSSDWITSELMMRLNSEVAERLLVEHWPHLRFSSYFVQTALYLATPTSCALAHEAVSLCSDVKKMFEHIHLHFGIQMYNHPGVSRIEQIKSLVPYLDHISALDIHSLWELCNKRGWFDFRRANLDRFLQGEWRNLSYLDESKIFADLADMIARNHIYRVHYWIDRFLSTGEHIDNIFRLLSNWFRKNRTIMALELVAEAVIYAGRHHDLDLFCIDDIEPAQDAKAIVADAHFAVRRRLLA